MRTKILNRILLALVVIAGSLAWAGWYSYLGISNIADALWTSFYYTLQTFIFETSFEGGPLPLALRIAAYLAPLSLAASILFGLIQKTRNAIQGVLIRSFVSNHTVMTGMTSEALALLSSPELSRRIVLIVHPDETVPDWIYSHRNTVVLVGSPDSSRMWIQAGIRRAKQALVFNNSLTSLPDILRSIALAGRWEKPFPVGVVVRNRNTYNVLTEFTNLLNANLPHPLQITPINPTHQIGVSLAWNLAPHRKIMSRDVLETQRPHLVVDGLTPLSEAFLLETGQQYHYPWHSHISVTVTNASVAAYDSFLSRYPGIVKVHAITHSTQADDSGIFDSKPYCVVAFAESPWDAPRVARRWRRTLIKVYGHDGLAIPVTVVLPPGGGEEAVTLERLNEQTSTFNVTLVSAMALMNPETLFERRELIDALASSVQEGYERLWGGSRTWADSSDWEREWNRRSARHLITKLWLLGYQLIESDQEESRIPSIGQEEHEMLRRLENKRWQAEKWLDDFIPALITPVDKTQENLFKNRLRIHKLLIPFDELSEEERVKDDNTFNLETVLEPVLGIRKIVPLHQQ